MSPMLRASRRARTATATNTRTSTRRFVPPNAPLVARGRGASFGADVVTLLQNRVTSGCVSLVRSMTAAFRLLAARRTAVGLIALAVVALGIGPTRFARADDGGAANTRASGLDAGEATAPEGGEAT